MDRDPGGRDHLHHQGAAAEAGEYNNYVPRGTIHRQQNLSDKPARYIEMRVFDKGKPASEAMD